LPTAADPGQIGRLVALSARNRFAGIVTRVEKDRVAAVVEVQAGPHRLVSLMTAEAVDELDLKVGDEAVCVVKATKRDRRDSLVAARSPGMSRLGRLVGAFVVALALLAACSSTPAAPAQLTVLVASSLSSSLTDLSAAWKTTNPNTTLVTFDGRHVRTSDAD